MCILISYLVFYLCWCKLPSSTFRIVCISNEVSVIRPLTDLCSWICRFCIRCYCSPLRAPMAFSGFEPWTGWIVPTINAIWTSHIFFPCLPIRTFIYSFIMLNIILKALKYFTGFVGITISFYIDFAGENSIFVLKIIRRLFG